MKKRFSYNICTIMTTGRTGSDYLAGCLDGVKNLMVFSGKFNHKSHFINQKEKIRKEILITKFVKENKKLFKYNKVENLKLNINILNFKKKFLEISDDVLDSKEFLIKLYETYHLILNRKLKKSNTIIHHSHGLENTKNFLDDFPNSKILITIRDPRANFKSGLLNWFKFDDNKKQMMHVFRYMRRIRNDLNFALEQKNKKKFIKLELMGSNKYKKQILKFLGTKYDKKITISTFANLTWNGDKLSNFKKKTYGSFNKDVINNNWNTFFTKDEILLLNLLYSNYRRFYKIKKTRIFDRIYLFFRSLLPFNFEKMVTNNADFFSNKFIKNIIFYLRRIIYVQLIILNIDKFKYEKKN